MTLLVLIYLSTHQRPARPDHVARGTVLERREQPMTCPAFHAAVESGRRVQLRSRRARCAPPKYFLLVARPWLGEEQWVEVDNIEYMDHPVGEEFSRE